MICPSVLFLLMLLGMSVGYPQRGMALESSFSGNYVIPESQSGFYAEQYEVAVGKKFQRGAENFFLGWLEVPHGVKSEFYYRRQQELNIGIDSVVLGLFRGFFNAVGRMGVGFYEVWTAPFPQPPILPEMHEWLY